MKKLLLFTCGLAIAAAVEAQIIHVPADYPTIQQGINAAASGDTVLVDEGTYYENINFLGKKPLIIASEFLVDHDTSHISNTIINGSLPVNPDIGSVVTFESGEDTTSVVCGFTITGGTGTIEPSVSMRMGGGVHIKYSGGKLLNNYIHNNTLSYNGGVLGGGLQLGGPISDLPWIVLRGNRIYNNQAVSEADYASGGGVVCYYNLIMKDNQISYNSSNGHLGGDGGGVGIYGAFGIITIDVSGNEVTHNESVTDFGTSAYAALGGGMGIYFDVTGSISNNAISNNSIDAPDNYRSWGPGVFIQDITPDSFIFENNIVNENIANSENSYGGGLSLLRSGGIYQNNVLQNNTATNGGGISIVESKDVNATAILINNTITVNDRGGMYVSTSDAVVINSILYNNTPPGPAIHAELSDLEVRYSDVDYDEYVYPGEGNVNIDPQFQSDGYHLDMTSLILNKGISNVTINSVSYDCPGYDIDGDLRPYANTLPDIGADETQWYSVTAGKTITTENYRIYPNPADQMLTISVSNGEAVKGISIYNHLGQNVYTGIPDDNTLDISKLQPGMYIIELVTDQGNIREKLIVE